MSKTKRKKGTSKPAGQTKHESPVKRAAQTSFFEKYDLKWTLPIVAVCLLVFANSLAGEFVYDDLRQIVRNPLIQDNSLIWQALTSDVWAFKGDGSLAASNYWRPTFTGWSILNFRLFGANPFGWHAANLLLHTGVCVIAYALMRRWQISAIIACAITLIFAVHPIHVESVAWISGSPDLLFALALLGSLWFAQNFAEKKKPLDLALSLLLYAVALGAKEVAILCFVLYYFVFSFGEKDNKKPASSTTPLLFYIALAGIYFFARLAIIGAFSRPPEDAPTFSEALFSVPLIFVFYLRQIFFPYWLSINYPLQAVSQIGLMNFAVPLIISLAFLALVIYLATRSKTGKLAVVLFILPLLPAMNATVFPADHIVHDRYLYLPLLGILMLLVPFAAKFLKEQYVLAGAVVLSLALGIQTYTYNSAWSSELNLWTRAVKVDASPQTLSQYASVLSELGRTDDAIRAYSEAIESKPIARSYLGRARNLILKKRYAEAEKDLNTVLQTPPEKMEAYALYQTYEAFGIAYSEQGKLDDAVKLFTDARQRLPIYSASLTANLAVVLYQKGQTEAALKELEDAQVQARKELLSDSKLVFMRLGTLYNELGRKEDAKKSLQEYLRVTASFTDKGTLVERAQAEKTLRSLN